MSKIYEYWQAIIGFSEFPEDKRMEIESKIKNFHDSILYEYNLCGDISTDSFGYFCEKEK